MTTPRCVVCGSFPKVDGGTCSSPILHEFVASTGNADEDAEIALALDPEDLSASAWETLVVNYGEERASEAWAAVCERMDEAKQEDDYARASEDAEGAERLQAIRISRERAAVACSADPVAAAVFYLGVVLEEALLHHPTGDFDDLVAGALRRLRVR